MPEKASTQGRIVQLDFIRVVAISLVVLVHTESRFLGAWNTAYLSAYVLGELGVPLFVMLTGFLMAHRDFSGDYTKRFLRRNLLPLFVAYEVWNVLWWAGQHWVPALRDLLIERPFVNMVKAAFFIGDTGNALWFLPMMLGLYLGLPIVATALRLFSRDGLRVYGMVLIGAAAFFGVLVPTISAVLSGWGYVQAIHPVLNMNIFGASVWGGSVWIVYLLLGYWLRKGNLRRVSTVWVVFVAVGAFCAEVLLKYGLQAYGEGVHVTYSSLFVLLCAVAVFELLRRVPLSSSGRIASVTSSVSAASFGIYMVHLWIATAMFYLLSQFFPSVLSGDSFAIALLSCAIGVFVCVLVSWAVVVLLSKIPGCGRWLFLMK